MQIDVASMQGRGGETICVLNEMEALRPKWDYKPPSARAQLTLREPMDHSPRSLA
jgi:hypothetical protein